MILTRALHLNEEEKLCRINVPETEGLEDFTGLWTNRLEVTRFYLKTVCDPESLDTYKLRGNR